MEKKIELEELKSIELDMVKFLKKVCEENNILFFMVGGTLLGSVRHNGFIPWDDDIDIAMPRKEFNKLKEIVNSQSSIYKIQFYDNVKDYGYSFPKLVDTRTTLIDYKLGNGKEVSSVFIDIFLYDGMGNNKITSELWYWTLKIFKKMVFLSRRNFKMESFIKTVIFSIPWLVCHLIGVKNLNYLFNHLASIKDFNDKKIVACVSGSYGRSELFKKSVFESTVDLNFEDITLPAPKEYDVYLKNIYGNYMQLPPIERRMSNHTSVEWWN